MFNLRLCNAATIRYSLLKFGHMHLCGKDYKDFSPHCCKCNSFGCIAAIRCVNACHGPHSDSVYSGSEHRQFNSPRLVKREAGFPNPRRALIGSNQLWRVNDSPYYKEYITATSNDRHGVSKYRPIECLLKSLFRLRTKTSKVRVTVPLCGETTLTGCFPAQKDTKAENFLFDDVIMDKKIS